MPSSNKELVISPEEQESMSKWIRTRCVGVLCKDENGRSSEIPGKWYWYEKYGNYCLICIAAVNNKVNPQKAAERQREKEQRARIRAIFGINDGI